MLSLGSSRGDYVPDMKEVLYIYCRVSTDQQKDQGSSLEEQERFGIELSQRLGMDYEVHNEGSHSGSETTIATRPVFSNLMSLVREGHVKHLFVEVIDRLTRDDMVSASVNRDLKDHGVTVHTRTTTYNMASIEDTFMMKLLGLFAQYDNQLRTQRLKTGKFIKAKQGFWMLGTLPFGYRMGKNKKLAIDKEQSVWVRKMYEWYDQGTSIPQIKRNLDGNVETNRGKVIWTGETIRKILKNTHHKGFYTYLGVKIPCPPIVERDLWERVNKVLDDTSTRQTATRRLGSGKGNKLYPYVLSPIMVCGHCGEKMIGESQKKSGGVTVHSYVCGSRNKRYKRGDYTPNWERGKYCPNTTSCVSERTEDVVWETLSEILKVSNQQKEKFKGLTLSTKKTSSQGRDQLISRTTTDISNLENLVTRIESSIEDQRIKKIETPKDVKKIDRFIGKLEESKEENLLKIQDLKNDLDNYLNDSLWVDWVKDYQDEMKNLDSLNRDERNQEITKYVRQVLVTFDEKSRNHTLKLKLKLPLVGDSLKYKDESKKSDGYEITEGSYEKETSL